MHSKPRRHTTMLPPPDDSQSPHPPSSCLPDGESARRCHRYRTKLVRQQPGYLWRLGIARIVRLSPAFVDEKFTDIHLMMRPLVLWTIATSHEKHSARDAHHLNIVV